MTVHNSFIEVQEQTPANPECIPALSVQDIALLPPSMQALEKIIGLHAVLQLARNYGGGAKLYIPMRSMAYHPLRKLIEGAAFEALCAEYGGEALVISRCARLIRTLQYRKIRAEYASGTAQGKLAIKYRLCTRQISTIVQGLSKGQAPATSPETKPL